MKEADKGCPMIRMGVSGRVFLLVPAYPCSPGQKAVKQLCVCDSGLSAAKLRANDSFVEQASHGALVILLGLLTLTITRQI